MTFESFLTSLQTELATRVQLDATVLYRRTADVAELSERRVVLQPAGFAVERINKAEPRRTWIVDLISEEHVAHDSVETTARIRAGEMEKIANSFTRRPLVGDAFCLKAETFGDAPAGVDSSILENGCALVLAGLRLTFIEN